LPKREGERSSGETCHGQDRRPDPQREGNPEAAALKEAQKADEHAKHLAAAEAEKKAMIEKLSQPSGLTEEEKVKLASTVIQRAVRNGLSEVQVYRRAGHEPRPGSPHMAEMRTLN
jgi:phage-related minor tail protein